MYHKGHQSKHINLLSLLKSLEVPWVIHCRRASMSMLKFCKSLEHCGHVYAWSTNRKVVKLMQHFVKVAQQLVKALKWWWQLTMVMMQVMKLNKQWWWQPIINYKAMWWQWTMVGNEVLTIAKNWKCENGSTKNHVVMDHKCPKPWHLI
jgi:hypothetical protein